MARKTGPQNRTGLWLIDNFSGGLSEGSRSGIPGSFRAGVGLDYRTDPDVVSSNRKLTKDSGSSIDAAVKWIVDQGTNKWFYQDDGKVIKRTSAGTYSTSTTITDGSGNGMAVFDDYLYVSGDASLSRYGPLSGTPTWSENFLKSPASEIDQNSGTLGGSNTYTLQTSISETATHRTTFTPTVSTISGVAVRLVAKGTGDVTVTVHDSSNNQIAAVTVASANLPTAGLTRFDFAGVYDITASSEYHFHVTVSTGTTTIRSTTTNDAETAEYAVFQEFTDEDVDQENDFTTTINEVDTYTLPTSISESSTARQTFTPDRSNILAVGVLIDDAGTGDWTLTVHDSNDTSVASKTITNANILEGKGWFKFTFSSATSIVPTASYHFHITSTVADGKVFASTSGSLETAAFQTYYQVLDTDTAWHPLIYFPTAQAMAIGNGNFLSLYDGILYREPGTNTGSETLQFDKGEKVRALTLVGDYIAIGTWKGDGIDDHGSANLYLWDGTSPGVNAFKTVPGEINALVVGEDGLLYVFYGGFGQVSVYDGGLTLLKTIPNIGENKYVEVYPGAVTNWRNMVHFGISDGDSTAVVRGVYSLGRKTKDYSRSLNLDYPLSTGHTGSAVTVTAVLGVGPSELYVAWKDTTSGTVYGVDAIDISNDQASTTYESLVFDAGLPYFEKRAKTVKLTFLPLTSGQTITVKYKRDRESSWQTLGSASTVGDVSKSIAFTPEKSRFNELELQITLATTGATGPSLISVTTFFEVVAATQNI